MPSGGAVAILQGGFRVGGGGHIQGCVPLLAFGRGEHRAPGEADAVPGCGGDASGEGDRVAVRFVLRGPGAASGAEWADRGGVREDTGVKGDDPDSDRRSCGISEESARAECHARKPCSTAAEAHCHTLCQPSTRSIKTGTSCFVLV